MLPALLLLPFLAALLFLVVPRKNLPASAPWLLTLATTGLCVALLGALTTQFDATNPLSLSIPWIPQIGLTFSVWLDGPALFYCWLVTGIGFLIFLYSGFYMDPKDSPWRFYGMMLFFMGSMLGVVVSRNALLMFLFWELTSISSFMLIGHWHHKDTARAGAVRALVVTGLGGLALMTGIAGLFWIMAQNGVDAVTALNWDSIWAHREMLTTHPLSGTIFLLLLLGAFTKSAQFPFHFWLPGAMEAPTPVSAYLHAATMVKAGIYLLGRLYPLYSDFGPWLPVVGGIGVITMGIGGIMALTSRDLKQLLAHSTVSQLGLLTAYYGFGYGHAGTEALLKLDLLLVGSHAMFKGALFMIVGIIDHGAHTREWTRLGGLRKTMPITTILTIAGCASMAGVPLTLGFVAKELFLKAAFHLHSDSHLIVYTLLGMAIFTSVFTAAYCYRMAISPFFGKPRDPSIHSHEGGLGLLFSPALLIILCVLGGLYVPLLEKPLAAVTNAAFYATKSTFTVGFFHHVDELFWAAMVIFGGGLAVFFVAEKFLLLYERLGSPGFFRSSYGAFFDDFVPSLGAWLARTVQPASLQSNVSRTLGVAFTVVLGAFVYSRHGLELRFDYVINDAMLVPIILVSILCLAVVLFHSVLLVRVVAIAPIGLFVAAFFVFYKAPDLALTQLLIEVATLLLILLVIVHFPQSFRQIKPDKWIGGRFGIALLGGLLMGIFAYTASDSPFRGVPTFEGEPSIHEYYLENAKYPKYKSDPQAALDANYPGAEALRSGGGSNAVNVILVDFRGIDTMGEVAVLGIAAIGILCLLYMGRRDDWKGTLEKLEHIEEIKELSNDEESPPPPEPKTFAEPAGGQSLLLAQIGRIVPGFIFLYSLVLFFAGHNEPGGGFIAGLLVSVGLMTMFVAFRFLQIPGLRRANFPLLIPLGLAIAVSTGLAAIAFGKPFLTSTFGYFHIPILGEVELASAAIFDLGVFLTVVGVTMTILGKLGKE